MVRLAGSGGSGRGNSGYSDLNPLLSELCQGSSVLGSIGGLDWLVAPDCACFVQYRTTVLYINYVGLWVGYAKVPCFGGCLPPVVA